MKKVLITGAFGYLGARLSSYLTVKGYSVIAFDRCIPSLYGQSGSLAEEVIIGDIRDESMVSKLAEKHFDTVIHLVSLDNNKSEGHPNFVSSINVMPTWNLLDTFTKKGLGRFIYFSTIHIYGKVPKKIINEEETPAPENVYGLTHLLSETICNYFNRKTETNCINVRLSNGYGSPVFMENSCWGLVLNDFCKSAFKQNKIALLSDGSPQRDFIHVDDICDALEILIEAKPEDLEDNIFHIASGETLTVLELAHSVQEVFKKIYKIEIPVYLPDNSISEKSNKYKDIERYHIDTARIRNLGFRHSKNLFDGIADTFRYLYESEL